MIFGLANRSADSIHYEIWIESAKSITVQFVQRRKLIITIMLIVMFVIAMQFIDYLFYLTTHVSNSMTMRMQTTMRMQRTIGYANATYWEVVRYIHTSTQQCKACRESGGTMIDDRHNLLLIMQ